MSPFKKAVIEQSKVRIALWGSSGTGKTRTGLEIASGLGQKIAVIDTEHGRSRHYADRYNFDVLELSSFHPNQYIQAIQSAEEGGYDVLIIDSLTHAWTGEGGLLETHANIVRRSSNKNDFTAWEEVTPMHRRLIEAILRSSLHIIVTMRAKTEYAMEVNEAGRTVPRKVGLGPEQRKGIEYEFDIIGYLDQDHVLTIEKDTSDLLQDQVIKFPTAELGMQLDAWFSRGDRPEWQFSTFHRDILMKAKVAQRWERADTSTLLELYNLERLEDIPDERTYQQIRQVLSFAPQSGLDRAKTLLSLKLRNPTKTDTSTAKQLTESIAS